MALVRAVTRLVLLLMHCAGALDGCRQDLDVTMPGSLQALCGSCVLVPCNFSTVPPEDLVVSNPVHAFWLKGTHAFDKNRENRDNFIFDSSKPKDGSPIMMTGNLLERDCTTLFDDLTTEYTDNYFFRIENPPSYMATAICDKLTITVKDSPPRPTLEIIGDQTEAEVVTIVRSAVTPCPRSPPRLTWDPHQGTANTPETNPDRTIKTTSTLDITLTDSHDGQVIKCSAAYPVKGEVKMADNNVTLSVRYGPKDTSVRVSPSESLSVGQSVTLNCSSRAKPPVQGFTWFRLSPQGPVHVAEGDTYTFNITEGGEYVCEASNGVRNHLSAAIELRIGGTLTVLWKAMIGAGVGFVMVVGLAVSLYFFRTKRLASRPTQEPPEEPGQAAEPEESIHYGELDFSKLSPKVSPHTEQETVYSEVKVSKPETAEPTRDLEELYAQVNKK